MPDHYERSRTSFRVSNAEATMCRVMTFPGARGLFMKRGGRAARGEQVPERSPTAMKLHVEGYWCRPALTRPGREGERRRGPSAAGPPYALDEDPNQYQHWS